MRNLLIIGARAGGRCLYQIVKERCVLPDVRIKGFLDDNPNALKGFSERFPPILSSVENYNIQKNDVFFCSLMDPKYRKKYVDIITARGGVFLSIISETAIVDPNAKIGDGSFIGDYAVVGDNVSIGDYSFITNFSLLGHDISIGDFSSIEPYSFLGGYITIGNGVFVHAHSSIASNLTIGDGASIGMGSVVLRNVASGEHIMGSPAKKILLWD